LALSGRYVHHRDRAVRSRPLTCQQQAQSGIYTSTDKAEPLRKLFQLLYTPNVALSPPNHFKELSQLYIIADRYIVAQRAKDRIITAFGNAVDELQFDAIPEFLAAAARLCRRITLSDDHIFTLALCAVDWQFLRIDRIDGHDRAWREFRSAVERDSPLFRRLARADALRRPTPARPNDPAFTTGCNCTLPVPRGLSPEQPSEAPVSVDVMVACHWCDQRYRERFWHEQNSGYQQLWSRVPPWKLANAPGGPAAFTDDDSE